MEISLQLHRSIVAQSKLNTVIRCGATKKVGKEPPWSFGFLHLPFLPLQSGPSLVDSAMKATSSPGMGLLWLKEVVKIVCVMVIRPKIHGDISPRKDTPTRVQCLCLYDDHANCEFELDGV